MEQNSKPLILEIEEAKIETLTAINEILQKHGLPCYLFENIIADVHKQISTVAQNEIKSVTQEYQKKQEENVKTKEIK